MSRNDETELLIRFLFFSSSIDFIVLSKRKLKKAWIFFIFNTLVVITIHFKRSHSLHSTNFLHSCSKILLKYLYCRNRAIKRKKKLRYR